jgi:proteasome accessory factor B
MSMVDDAKTIKVRRQFGLILTLISSRYGLTKDEILSSVEGYKSQFDLANTETKKESLYQVFERDKDEIRALGIVIDTFSVEEAWGDNQNTRYRIVEEDYDFPPDVTFSETEMALLRLAGEAWRDGSLSLDSRHALTKLRSLGIPVSEPLIGLAPRINAGGAVFEALKDIMDRNGFASFLYLKPGTTEPSLRNAAPLALVNRRGLWYVLAFDSNADAERTFLLSRIVNLPKRTGAKVHEPRSADFAAQLEAELDAMDAQNVAKVWVEPESDAAVRLAVTYGALDSENNLSVHFSDIDLLADELTEYGNTVRAIAPETLKRALTARFSALVSAHEGTH